MEPPRMARLARRSPPEMMIDQSCRSCELPCEAKLFWDLVGLKFVPRSFETLFFDKSAHEYWLQLSDIGPLCIYETLPRKQKLHLDLYFIHLT